MDFIRCADCGGAVCPLGAPPPGPHARPAGLQLLPDGLRARAPGSARPLGGAVSAVRGADERECLVGPIHRGG